MDVTDKLLETHSDYISNVAGANKRMERAKSLVRARTMNKVRNLEQKVYRRLKEMNLI